MCPVCIEPAGEALVDGFGGVNDVPPDADFMRAIEERAFTLAIAMYGADADVSCMDDKPLRWAAARGDLEAVNLLLELGADPTAMGSQALEWAYKNGHQEVVDVLIENGADESVLRRDAADEKPITSGGTWNAESHRWWGCPICKIYIDALVDGKLVDADRVKCPVCGCLELDADDGDHFLPGHEIVLADATRDKIDPTVMLAVKEARAMLTEGGLFSADDNDEEPKWPKDLAAVILAIGARAKKQIDEHDDSGCMSEAQIQAVIAGWKVEEERNQL